MASSINALIAAGGNPDTHINTPMEIQQNRVNLEQLKIAKQAQERQQREQMRAERDQKILSDAFVSSGGDSRQWEKLAVSGGLSPQGYVAFQDLMLGQRKKIREAEEADLKFANDRATAISNNATAFLNLPKDAQARNLPAFTDQLKGLGLLAQDAESLDEDAVRYLAAAGRNAKDLISEAMEERKQAIAEAAEKRAQDTYTEAAPVRTAENATKVKIAEATGKDPNLLTPERRQSATETADTAAALAAERATDNAAAAARDAETALHNRETEATARANAETSRINATKPGAGGGGKALPVTAVKSLETAAAARDQAQRLLNDFRPEYAGQWFAGSARNWLGSKIGDESGQTQFWESVNGYINDIRHGKFGGALTEGERKEFEKEAQTLRVGANPEEVRKHLTRLSEISNKALKRQAQVWRAGGYNSDQVDLYDESGGGAGAAPPPAVPAGGSASFSVERNGKRITTSALQRGDVITLRDGRPRKITAVYPDGTFDAD